MEVAVYALLCTESVSHQAALAYVFELDEDTGMMQHAFIKSHPINSAQIETAQKFIKNNNEYVVEESKRCKDGDF